MSTLHQQLLDKSDHHHSNQYMVDLESLEYEDHIPNIKYYL
jgi:hypothetical protein